MDSRGFTLIELMMVVLVIGIVLTAGLPALGTYRDGMVLIQARTQVLQDLRLARQVAVTRHCPVIVSFGNGTGTTDIGNYTIHYDTDGDGAVTAGERRFNRTMPSRTRVSSAAVTPTDSVVFDMSGVLKIPTSGAAPGGTLTLANSRGRTETIMISATGVVYRP